MHGTIQVKSWLKKKTKKPRVFNELMLTHLIMRVTSFRKIAIFIYKNPNWIVVYNSFWCINRTIINVECALHPIFEIWLLIVKPGSRQTNSHCNGHKNICEIHFVARNTNSMKILKYRHNSVNRTVWIKVSIFSDRLKNDMKKRTAY